MTLLIDNSDIKWISQGKNNVYNFIPTPSYIAEHLPYSLIKHMNGLESDSNKLLAFFTIELKQIMFKLKHMNTTSKMMINVNMLNMAFICNINTI